MSPICLLLLASPVRAQGPPAGDGGAGNETANEANEANEATPAEALDDPPMLLVPPRLQTHPPLAFPADQPPGAYPVLIVLTIEADGSVSGAEIFSGDAPFTDLALEAAPGFVFTPAQLDGEPTAVRYPFEVVFEPPEINVSGAVVVSGLRDPLPGIEVAVGGYTVITDADGAFALRGVPPGAYTAQIMSPAYRTPRTEFTLARGDEIELEIFVKPIGALEEAVGVYRKFEGQIVVHTLSAEEVATTPGTMGDPVRAVQNLPGVVHTPLDSGWLLVRGGDPEDTGVFIDGIRVPLVYHLGGFTSVLHPAFIEEVAYMPGGYSARYGRTSAGVVDLMTGSDHHPRAQIEGSVDLIHAGVFARFPLGEDLGVAAAVRRSYLDRVLALVLDEESAQIAPRFFDWQARIDGKSGGVFVLGYTDQIDAPTGEDDEVVTITIGTQRVHGRWARDIDDATALVVQPYLALERSDIIYEDAEARESTVAGLRAELKTSGRMVGVQGGLDAEFGDYRLDLDDDIAESGGERSVNSAWRSIEPYAHGRIGRVEGARAELGARLDDIKIEDQYWRVGVSPRLRGVAPVNEALTFVADLGVYHQPPDMDLASVMPAGPSLKLERSWGPGLGARIGREGLTLQVDGYYRRMANLAMFEADGSLVQGEGLSYGLENMVRWSRGALSGWTAYTWSRSRRLEDSTALWRAHSFEQPHYLVQVIGWRLPGRWNLSSRFRLGSGYPWQSAEFETFDLLTQEEEPLDPNIHLRLQPYHSLDLKVSRDFLFKSWKLDAYLDVQNLYNRRVPEPVITGIDAGDSWYSYGLPTLLIFGVKGVFWP